MLKCVCRQGLCYRALNPNKSTWCQEEKLQPKAGVHCHSPLASGHSGKIRPLPSHWLFHLPLLRPPGQRYSASRGVPCLCIREQAQQAQDQHCGLPLQAVPFLRQLLQAKGLEGKKQHKTKQNKMHVCWEHSSPLLLPCTKEQAPFSCLYHVGVRIITGHRAPTLLWCSHAWCRSTHRHPHQLLDIQSIHLWGYYPAQGLTPRNLMLVKGSMAVMLALGHDSFSSDSSAV